MKPNLKLMKLFEDVVKTAEEKHGIRLTRILLSAVDEEGQPVKIGSANITSTMHLNPFDGPKLVAEISVHQVN